MIGCRRSAVAVAIMATLGMGMSGGSARAEGQPGGLAASHKIPAFLASEAVADAVGACAKQNYTETAVIVDADGVRIAMLRGDGAGAHTLDSAFYKAYTAASFKTDTTALVERAKTNPTVTNLVAKLPNLVMAGGGLVIKAGNEVLGAIGAAGAPGADLDDACAKAGLDKIKDWLK